MTPVPLACEAVRESLPGHLRGEGDATERAAVDAHVATCEACRAEAAEADRVRGLLALARVDAEPRGDAFEKLRAAVAQTPQLRRARRWPYAAAAAAAAAGLLAWAAAFGIPGRDQHGWGAVLDRPLIRRVATRVLAGEIVWDFSLSNPERNGGFHCPPPVPARTGEWCGGLEGVYVAGAAGATLERADGILIFAPRSSFRLNPVELTGGAVVVRGSLSMSTPQATIRDLGTTYSVDFASLGGTRVSVFHGSVEIVSSEGSGRLQSGESVIIPSTSDRKKPDTSKPLPRSCFSSAAWPTTLALGRAPEAELSTPPTTPCAGDPVVLPFRLFDSGPGIVALAPPNPRDPLFSATIEAEGSGRGGSEGKVQLQRVSVREVTPTAGPVRLLGPGESYDLLVDVGPGITKPGRYKVVVRYAATAAVGEGLFVGSVESAPLAIEVK